MRTVLSLIPWFVGGVALGYGSVYLHDRLTRAHPGLVERVRAKRRGDVMLAVMWVVVDVLNLTVFVTGGSWWRLLVATGASLLAAYYLNQIRRQTRILNSPYLYLLAISDLGEES